MYKRISTKQTITNDNANVNDIIEKPIDDDDDFTEIDYEINDRPNQHILLKSDELVGLITNTICQFTQEIVTFPIYSLYITSQIMNHPYPSYYFPWTVLNSLYNGYMIRGGSYLWRGFPSYTILSGSLNIGDTLLCYITQKYITSGWLNSPILFIERCVANFIVAPFYTSMLVDCIMSDSITAGMRSPFFFIVEGSKLMFSKRCRYRNYPFSYLSSRPINLYDRFIAYTMIIFGRCVITNIVYRFYMYVYKPNTNYIYNQNTDDSNKIDVIIDEQIDTDMITNKYCNKLTANLVANIITDVLMLPVMSGGIKCLMQGLDIFVDTITKQSIDNVGSNVIPANQTYFKDIFECITTIYDDCGIIQGFCKGLGAIILGSIIKYSIVRISTKFLLFYNRKSTIQYDESSLQ